MTSIDPDRRVGGGGGGGGAGTATHDGKELREMFAAATHWLECNTQAINSINVFPVPDGDTGTNMYLTMLATMDEAYQSGSEAANVVAGAMARGALMGARGNSGVILSQILRGFADGLSDKERFDGQDFVAALDEATLRADRAVTHPVEGTILTVMRAVAAAARDCSKELGGNLKAILAAAVDAAKDAVAKTPSLLPALREAGVVDAGGQGLYVMLEGALRYVRGDLASLAPLAVQDPERSWARATTALHGGEECNLGFCTEFLVSGDKLNAGSVLERMLDMGDSVLVVGDEKLLRVHLHTAEPDAAIAFARSLGELSQVKVDNIEEQAERFMAHARGYEGDLAAVGIVAVVSGVGLEDVFRSLGATAIVQGGATMNPSTRQILAAVESCPQEDVIVLPNNKNVILAGQQAAKHSHKRVRVVGTTSVPQGMAALVALGPEQDLDANAGLMEAARQDVRTIEVTKAIRTTSIDGLRVRIGQAIALVDGKLTVADDSPHAAVLEALRQTVSSETSLVTIYFGAESTREDAEGLAAEIRAMYPSLETEVVSGGQPHYAYIVSLE
ncbi:MAG: DAK2 domain-containing protein [Dehalococcoidia bacterium]